MTEPRSREDRLHQALDKHGEQDKAASENQVASLSSPQEAIAHHKEQAIATEKEQETEAPTEAATEAATEAEFEAAWFDATLDASVFFALEHVPPVQAAMLLCQFNPHDSTESEAESGSTDKTSPEDFKRLRTTFLSIDLTKPAHRSMQDWMAIAVRAGLAVHPWAQQYVQHRGLYIAAEPKPTEFALDAGQMSGTPTENPAPAPAPADEVEVAKVRTPRHRDDLADAKANCSRSISASVYPCIAEYKARKDDERSKPWSNELVEEVYKFDQEHGLKNTAEELGISQAAVTKHLAKKKKASANLKKHAPWFPV